MALARRGKARKAKSRPSRDKVQAHRARLRAQGLRTLQIWVPDVCSPRFASEARRQSRLAAQSAHAQEDQAFVDAISIFKIP